MSREQAFAGNSKFGNKSLQDIFSNKVFNPQIAWYIDYYLKEVLLNYVNFLATCPETGKTIKATDENKEVRDPNDIENSQWSGEDVKNWFVETNETGEEEEKIQHRWILLFEAKNRENFGIHFEAYRVFCFGPSSLHLPTENLWEEYVEDGLFGPIEASGQDKPQILYLIDQPDVFGFLDKTGLVNEYMVALANILAD